MLNDESSSNFDFNFDFNFNSHDLSYGLDPVLLSAQQANAGVENADEDLIEPQHTDLTTTEIGLLELYSDQVHELGFELPDFTDATPTSSIDCEYEHQDGDGSEHSLVPKNSPDLVCYGMVS